MKYSQIKEHLERYIHTKAREERLPLQIHPFQKTAHLASMKLPAVAVVIASAKNVAREGRASLGKAVEIKVIVIESDGKYDSVYLDFLERIFQKSYFTISVGAVLNSDLSYTGFATKFRDEGEKLIAFCTLSFELHLEEALPDE